MNEINGRAPIITGLYLSEIPDGQFPVAVENSFKGGAKGVALFDWGSFEDKHFHVMKSLKSK